MTTRDVNCEEDAPKHPSRAEVETLSILYSVGSGCTVHELTVRLGLPMHLAAVVDQAVGDLVSEGHLELADGQVTLEEAGGRFLQQCLAELGIQSAVSL